MAEQEADCSDSTIVSALLIEIGIRPSLQGYDYLKEAVLINNRKRLGFPTCKRHIASIGYQCCQIQRKCRLSFAGITLYNCYLSKRNIRIPQPFDLSAFYVFIIVYLIRSIAHFILPPEDKLLALCLNKLYNIDATFWS